MRTLSLDLETYSDVDLVKCGVYRYCESPNFEILLFGCAVDDGDVQVIDLARGEKIPEEILAALTDDAVTKWAFNANFERICLSHYLRDQGVYPAPFHDRRPLSGECAQFLDPAGWKCSMVLAAYNGLPFSLKDVGKVLNLGEQKLDEGKALIRYFSMPCKPTKANGGRTRNKPSDAPEKWETFKAYNRRDVEVETAIHKRLEHFPVPDAVWDEYHLDQEINDRGILIDHELVTQAIRMDAVSRDKLIAELKEKTGLENPNSVMQMKAYLEKNGLKMDSLGKKEVAAAIRTAPPALAEILVLRQQLAKSSVKKYQAMANAACADGRVRGMYRFYGANRTGRWASRLINVQNLPQNHIPDLAAARALVKSGDYEMTTLLYGDVPDTLSQLIRTALVPSPGRKFIVSDFSAIEARVIAWLAGEKWKSAAFARGEDIYCSTASRMFGVPVVKHGVNGALRQKGKIAELACIAENELVLTDHGEKPIQDVMLSDRVWDGENWVRHEGVIFKGEKEVITYDGLTATPDHLVFIEGESEPVTFARAAESGARLVQSANCGQPLRLGDRHFPRKTLEQELEPLQSSDEMQRLRQNRMDGIGKPPTRAIQRLPALLTAKADSPVAVQTADGRETAMRKSSRAGMGELRSTRNPVLFPLRDSRWPVSHQDVWETGQEHGNRPHRHEWELRTRKHSLRHPSGEPAKQTRHSALPFRAALLALRLYGGHSKIVARIKPGRNYPECPDRRAEETEKLAYHKRTARLYDIRNAGQHHRFTVSGKLVHNCGYGGSVGALKAMGALEMGLKEAELPSLVESWRAANPNIVQLWWDVDHCVTETVKHHVRTATRGITFTYKSGMMFIALPSGRQLAYAKPRMGLNRFGSESATYEGIGPGKKWERIESYGPKFVENIVQAISRDILAYTMKTLRNCDIVGHVHDELIIECDKGVSLEAVCEQMGRTPQWADGLKLQADGYECRFYMKE